MKCLIKWLLLACVITVGSITHAADSVPPVIEQPGTQPGELSNLESPDKCDNCHGGYNSAVEPAHNWRGSMMAHAGRDPIFWATVAIAEQDFDGAGDLCIRCHSTTGWLAGRSTPTDGSGLAASDSDGVDCDYCHKLTNPDDSEHIGVMNQNFIANEPDSADPFDWDEANNIEGYYGSGMSSMWGGSDKLGPYTFSQGETTPKHQYMRSKFHRDRDFCGTCHDVSNPAVGHMAPNNGTQATADSVVTGGGNPGNPANDNVAFNNPPYAYGIVERTFSEYKSGQISRTLVNDYDNLPQELRGGVLEAAYNAATQNGTIDGNYQNPSMPRYFSCQTCHMRAVQGVGANKNGVTVRDDLPLHDLTGGNYWMPEVIEYLDSQGKLRLGGGMSASQITAMQDGALRAREQLDLAATLSAYSESEKVEVKIVNHTGHKLISGYPEGRRMWLRTEWFDESGNSLGVDGEYGDFQLSMDVDGNGENDTVKTILDLDGTNSKIYEAHMGMTQAWAFKLNPDCETNSSPLPLGYDRITGEPDYTLGELACANPGTEHETFHFVLNNTVIKDNRIPPYGMDYESARVRNALPVPETQYYDSVTKTYDYYDEVDLIPPSGAVSATIELMYQPTSWEYIQFLYLANTLPQGAFLADEGKNMLAGWLNTGMAEPHVMASTTWGTPPSACEAPVPQLVSATAGDSQVDVLWEALPDVNYSLYYDQSGKAQLVVAGLTTTSYQDSGLTNGQEYCYKLTSTVSGDMSCESGFGNILCTTPSQPGQQVTVPDVAGKLLSEAENDIVTAGLVVGTVGTSYSDTVATDHVISQQPTGSSELPKGDPVDLVVSLGAAPTLACSGILDKSSCNNEPLCAWEGNPRNGRCTDVVACSPTPGEETKELSCTDGNDNDCDGLIDSADPDCGSAVDCSIYDGNEASCKAITACRWSRKNSLCLNR